MRGEVGCRNRKAMGTEAQVWPLIDLQPIGAKAGLSQGRSTASEDLGMYEARVIAFMTLEMPQASSHGPPPMNH